MEHQAPDAERKPVTLLELQARRQSEVGARAVADKMERIRIHAVFAGMLGKVLDGIDRIVQRRWPRMLRSQPIPHAHHVHAVAIGDSGAQRIAFAHIAQRKAATMQLEHHGRFAALGPVGARSMRRDVQPTRNPASGGLGHLLPRKASALQRAGNPSTHQGDDAFQLLAFAICQRITSSSFIEEEDRVRASGEICSQVQKKTAEGSERAIAVCASVQTESGDPPARTQTHLKRRCGARRRADGRFLYLPSMIYLDLSRI